MQHCEDTDPFANARRERKPALYGVADLGKALRTIYSVRENIYVHLAKTFYGSFVPEAFPEEVQPFIDYLDLLGDFGGSLVPSVGRYCQAAEQLRPEDADPLEFEYNRLFVGPSRLVAPPYESVYRTEEHLVMGETVLDVRRAYREIGLEARNALREPEDHIATELEYLAELQKRCLAALEGEDRSEVARCIRLEREFLETHLLIWTPEFCRRIIEGSPMEFFSALADLVLQLVKKDCELLKGVEALEH